MMKKLYAAVFLCLLLPLLLCAATFAESTEDYIEVPGEYFDESARPAGFLYSDSLLTNGNGATVFSGDLCKISVVLASAAYDEGTVQGDILNMGYNDFCKTYDYGGRTLEDNDRVAFAVGRKRIDGWVIYCIAIRGTGYNAEWFSDFNIGNPEENDGYHRGFLLAANKVQSVLDGLFSGDGATKERRILWFTGHSRGAAVANILAQKYTSGGVYSTKDRIFAYNFACPNVRLHASGSYGNIYNFNNAGDAIPLVPLESWGYGRYGSTQTRTISAVQEFETTYQKEFGGPNHSAQDSISYTEIIKKIASSPEDMDKPATRLGLMLTAWALGGHTDVSLPQVLEKFGKEVLPSYLFQKLLSKLGLDDLYDYLKGETNHNSKEKFLEELVETTKSFGELKFVSWLNGMKLFLAEIEEETGVEITDWASLKQAYITLSDEGFLRDAIMQTEGYSEEEFANWELEHHDRLVEIGKKAATTIRENVDLPPTLNAILTLGPACWDIGEVIAYLKDIRSSGGGSAMQAVGDGHRPGTYVLYFNSIYYGFNAYAGTEHTSVSIPENVVTIGPGCFSYSKLVTAEGLDHVKAVGNGAFVGCESLQGSAELSDAKLIGESAFNSCTSLAEIVLSNELTELGDYAFHGCTGVREVTVPIDLDVPDRFYGCTGVEKIHYLKGRTGVMQDRNPEPYGFGIDPTTYIGGTMENNSLAKLWSVDFEEGITHIGNYAFYAANPDTLGEGGLKHVQFPSTLESIGEKAFYGQRNLREAIVLPEGFTTLGKGCFEKTGIPSVEIPEGVTEIPEECFLEAYELRSAKLPQSATVIGAWAFTSCEKLTELEMNPGVTSVGESAFSCCTGLTEIVLSNELTELGDHAFSSCTGVTEVTVPIDLDVPDRFFECTGVEKIHYLKGRTGVMQDRNPEPYGFGIDPTTYIGGTMENNSLAKLWSIDFEEGITHIGNYAFYVENPDTLGKGGLKHVQFPSTLESIGEKAFYGQRNLREAIVLPEGFTTLGKGCFEKTGILSVEIPEGVTEIPEECFLEAYELRSAKLPQSATVIGAWAFTSCEKLTELEMNPGVTSVGESAFSCCTGLTEIVLSNELTELGDHAFSSCTGVTEVTVPIDLDVPDRFFECTGVEKIHYLKGRTGVMQDRNPKAYSDPATYIGGTMENNSLAKLWSIDFEEGITHIGNYAFYVENPDTLGEGGLKHVQFPSTLESIGEKAFYGQRNLREAIVLPEGFTTLGKGCFEKTGIPSAEIPEGVTGIPEYCFAECGQLLRFVTYRAKDLAAIEGSAFTGCRPLLTFFDVPGTEAEAYANRYGFRFVAYGQDTLRLPAGVTEIGEEAFRNSAFNWVYIPASVGRIGAGAFAECGRLLGVYIPDSVGEIAPDAFKNSDYAVIYCREGSAAWDYAVRYGIAFVLTE